jgi:hypothetical protein
LVLEVLKAREVFKALNRQGRKDQEDHRVALAQLDHKDHKAYRGQGVLKGHRGQAYKVT